MMTIEAIEKRLNTYQKDLQTVLDAISRIDLQKEQLTAKRFAFVGAIECMNEVKANEIKAIEDKAAEKSDDKKKEVK